MILDNGKEHEMKIEFNIITLLIVIFIVLKLCGIVTWSWWVVFSPILAVVFVGLLASIILAITEN